MSRLTERRVRLGDEIFGAVLTAYPRRRRSRGLAQTVRGCCRTAAKRGFDMTVAGLALILLSVPLLLIAVAVKLDSRGPVFYRVRRVGYRGAPLLMLKFRKMRHDAAGLSLTANADPRLTRVGSLLTRTRLDELPQLWDVLRGRMSIVGPRPEAPEFVDLHRDAYGWILSVRPGITGLSQLAFAAEREILNPDDLIGDYTGRILPQKVGLDILYAREHKLRSDLAVLAWTTATVALGKPVAVNRRNGTLTLRRRSGQRPAVGGAQRVHSTS